MQAANEKKPLSHSKASQLAMSLGRNPNLINPWSLWTATLSIVFISVVEGYLRSIHKQQNQSLPMNFRHELVAGAKPELWRSSCRNKSWLEHNACDETTTLTALGSAFKYLARLSNTGIVEPLYMLISFKTAARERIRKPFWSAVAQKRYFTPATVQATMPRFLWE